MKRSLAAVLVLLTISVSCAHADVPPPPKMGGNADAADAWWTPQQAGWLGAIVGSSTGILGGVVGTLGGIGVARRFVLTLALTLIGLGGLFLSAGIVAVVMGQPYHVFFFLLLLGGILLFSLGINYPVLKRRYAQRELQKMSALDS